MQLATEHATPASTGAAEVAQVAAADLAEQLEPALIHHGDRAYRSDRVQLATEPTATTARVQLARAGPPRTARGRARHTGNRAEDRATALAAEHTTPATEPTIAATALAAEQLAAKHTAATAGSSRPSTPRQQPS